MAKDPICGMHVEESTDLKAECNGQMFYFCSEHCRTKFLGGKKPAGDPAGKTRKQPENPYFCPMCEGVESREPGSCPKCGMALEREGGAAAAKQTVYTCPMHPEVEQEEPGACPKCGMELEPRDVEPEEDVELRSMVRRFWVGLVLGVPVLLLAMGGWFQGATCKG